MPCVQGLEEAGVSILPWDWDCSELNGIWMMKTDLLEPMIKGQSFLFAYLHL